jgi:conjugative transposon protein TcpC
VASARAKAAVTVSARPLWRLRLRREYPRHLLHALALFGLLASARFAVDPPAPPAPRAPARAAATDDRAAEGFAVLFARRYLTWDAADPEAHREALDPYLGPEMEAEAGFQPPQSGSQRVQWTQVVQASDDGAGGRYTVAVQTDASGLLYLAVGVVRTTGGALALSGYPALVGPPPSAPAPGPPRLEEAQDGALATVVTRALRNYLAGAGSELAADLTPGARVAPPPAPLQLQSLDALDWERAGRTLLALVHAQDARGARYALAYRLTVAASAGRWEIAAIEVDGGR